MAGHLPIGQGGFDHLIKLQFTKENIESLVDFENNTNILKDITVQRLPVNEYYMDDEHGKVDKYVIYFYKLDVDDYSYEVHLDEDLNINQVYLVM
jgi:hypothetical protein